MTFTVNSSKLTGGPDEAGWSQVYDFDGGEQVYVVLGMKNGQEGVDSVIAGRDILSLFQKEYIAIPKPISLKLIKQIIENLINKFGMKDGLQIGVIVDLGNFIYLLAGGGAKVCLMRKGVLVSVINSTFGKAVSASGLIKNNDIFVIATSSFFEKIDVNSHLPFDELSNTELAVEHFAPLVHTLNNSGDVGVSFVKFVDTKSIESENLITKIDKVKYQNPLPEYVHSLNKAINITKSKFDPSYLKEMFEHQLYVGSGNYSPEAIKKRKNSALVGILLLLLLTISISFGVKQKRQQDFKNNYIKELTAAKHDVEEAQNLINLNPERSRELFANARDRVMELSAKGIKDAELTNLRSSMDTIQGVVLGEYVSAPELYIDLGLLSDGFSGNEMILTDGLIYVLDRSSKKIVKVTINNKHSEIVAGPSKVNDNSQLLAYSDNIYISDGEGIFDISENRKKIIDKTWQGETLSYSYSGNIYVIDKQDSKIWRYSPGKDKFSDGKSWLAEDVKADFSNTKSMVIDGSIWVLLDDGNILRFISGNQQRFKLPSDLTNLKSEFMFTGDEINYLYLLDKIEGRIVVLAKDGVYKAQYISDEIKNTTNLVVSEKDKRIILLNGNKLLSIELRHL